MRNKLMLILILFIQILCAKIFAQDIAHKINYQGVLKDAAGVVSNGEYILTFKFYNSESAGAQLWSETKPINVTDGIINTVLGNVEPIPSPIFFESIWLGITIGSGSELTPRIALTSVPYSFMSMNVPDSSINSAKIPTGQVVKSLNGLKDSIMLVAGSNITLTPSGNNITISSTGGGTGTISGSGTTNYLPRFSGESTIANSIIYQIAGNLGIGTTTPTLKLELAGSDAKIHGLTLGRGSGSRGTNVTFGFQSLDANTNGESNTAIGFSSLHANTIGERNSAFGSQSLLSNINGSRNSAFGVASLSQNIDGNDNTGYGDLSLHSNTTGDENSAFGTQSLTNNLGGGRNSAFGSSSLFSNIGGYGNCAFGWASLNANTAGSDNTAIGYLSLSANTSGDNNTSIGRQSLNANTIGHDNTAIGYAALYENTTGHFNAAIGYNAGSNITSGSNNICIGTQAYVPSGTSDFQVRIGNAFITYAGIQVGWTITSDERWKSDITQSAIGLNFISKLRPVSYIRKNDQNQKIEYGFIAQEIEEVLNELGVEKAGMITIDDEGRYELRYNDLLAPLVKAVQEQQKTIEALERRIEELERR